MSQTMQMGLTYPRIRRVASVFLAACGWWEGGGEYYCKTVRVFSQEREISPQQDFADARFSQEREPRSQDLRGCEV